MNTEHELRVVHIEQLSKLLVMVQDVAYKLANESHGRCYDQVRELNEILHLARVQIGEIQTEASNPGAPFGVERRKSARSRFADLG